MTGKLPPNHFKTPPTASQKSMQTLSTHGSAQKKTSMVSKYKSSTQQTPPPNKVRTNQEGVATAKKFSWRNTAESIMKALEINV